LRIFISSIAHGLKKSFALWRERRYYLCMMERIYLDTSVFGGYFDHEFEIWSKILFDRIKKGQYKLLLSRVIDIELTNAPQCVKELALSIPDEQIEFLETTNEATELADTYIKENVVGETCRADCLHIALATLTTQTF
jgi:hypothetical protein